MMKELYENGPFVVSFEPDYNFMFYQSGVFHSVENIPGVDIPLFKKPEWEKVDHSVLLVGWGEDPVTGEKYWLVQNTWGPDWGENGFFRIRRGTDESAIESICEAGTPIIVDNKTKLSLMADKKSRLRPGIVQLNQGIQKPSIKVMKSQFPLNLISILAF
jgi:cathepsin C